MSTLLEAINELSAGMIDQTPLYEATWYSFQFFHSRHAIVFILEILIRFSQYF